MCGIIGYVGNKDITSVLISGLERLSYRGYDSSGIGVISNNEINFWKKSGKIVTLKNHIKDLIINSTIGIGHTRWATHGIANDVNAHPHMSQDNKICLIHNGIIENFLELKRKLKQKGFFFKSETDSEIIANLYQDELSKKSKTAALQATLKQLEGSYSLAILNEDYPEEILCCRKESPLIIGLGEKENFICSDINVLIYYTKKYIELEENEIAFVSTKGVKVLNQKGQVVKKKIQKVTWDYDLSKKGNYDFFMLKEIHEQAAVLRKIIVNYINNDKIDFKNSNFLEDKETLKNLNRFIIQACGTSWHAGLVGEYWIEKLAHILCDVDISSELRYRNYQYQRNEVMLTLSQSGETADALACLREAKSFFLKSIGFVNVQGSAIDRESDDSIYSQAGQEVGVASTKNYSAQLLNLFLFSLKLGYKKKIINKQNYQAYLKKIHNIPALIEKVLLQEEAIKKIAKRYYKRKNFIFIGRGINYPNALEGALKLKEISYIHATGYASGELKHGPLALIDSKTPVICIVPDGDLYKKSLNNLLEVKARKGKTIAIASSGNKEIAEIADEVIFIPQVEEEISPLLTIIPLQLLSYYVAWFLGRNVDQPKNLAKSVTVE